MKKRNQRLIGFWITVFLLLCVRSVPVWAETDKTGLYEENLSFDSQGNLHMTTHDKKAGGGVRYRTLGWIMRRTKEGGDAGQSVRLRLEEDGIPRPDPDAPGYLFTYFKCAGDLIFAKIGAASADWQMDLYQNGGFVYLDAVMTVVENGIAQGGMDADGLVYGEVYTTAEGIMNARDWADPQALLTHYNKKVYFPGVPELLVPHPGEEQEERVRFSYGQEECRTCNEALLRAAAADKNGEPQFDVTKGIPTGEQLLVCASVQKYYYEGVLKHYFGVVAVPVEMEVTYTYPVETEHGISTGVFTCSFTYYVERTYSYYRIEQIAFYSLKDILIENQALPDSPMKFENLFEPRVTLEQNRDSYMEIPLCRASVSGGSLLDGNGLSDAQLRAAAEQAADDVWVRNDALIVDGEIILDGSFVRRAAQGIRKQDGARLCTVSTGAITIPNTKRNKVYGTYAVAHYEELQEKKRQSRRVAHVNEVVVHTPVVCKGGVTNDIAHNQQVYPTSRCSLVLGRNFTVGISVSGQHKEQKGYGKRDYGKYTKARQVRFPFEVYDGETWIAAGTWTDLPREQKRFYLPPGVHEGDYHIDFRTLASNVDAKKGGAEKNGYLANLLMEHYGAYDGLTVTVIGRMYDLAITDLVDYPRWKSVFYEADGKKKPFAFWIGEKNLEGQTIAARAAAGRLPVLRGSHPYNPDAGAVGLGYRVKLQLKTVGDMRGENDTIVFFPTYYYVSRDGKEQKEVRLYRRDDLTEVKKILVLGAGERSFVSVRRRNVSDAALQARSVQVWDGEYQLPPDVYAVASDVNLDTYLRLHGGRIRLNDPVFLRDGYLLVRFEIRSWRDGSAQLSYVNRENSPRGYCNMWRMQGFLYERTDGAGHMFHFADGDCLLFDIRHSLHSDYESWGTH